MPGHGERNCVLPTAWNKNRAKAFQFRDLLILDFKMLPSLQLWRLHPFLSDVGTGTTLSPPDHLAISSVV